MGASLSKIECVLNSQNVQNNTSNITVKLYVSWNNSTYDTTGNASCQITINGTKYATKYITINPNRTSSGEALAASQTINVTHGSDGKKTVTYSGSCSFDSKTVSGSKALTAIPVAYTLTLSAGTGTTLSASRKSSPSGLTGTVASGAKIWAGDVLTFAASAAVGYGNLAVKVNGSAYTIGSNYTVASAVSAISSAELQGCAYIENERYLCYIWNGSNWDQYIPYLHNGTSWEILA